MHNNMRVCDLGFSLGVPAEKRVNSFNVYMLRKSKSFGFAQDMAFACTPSLSLRAGFGGESRFSHFGNPHRVRSAGTAGFSLIEVLVSLLLVSILLTGMIAIQYIAQRDTQTAYYLSIAQIQMNNLFERLTLADNFADVINISDQLDLWNEQNQAVLPHGVGTFTRDGNTYNISIFWNGAKKTNTCQQNQIGISGCLRLTIERLSE